MTLTYEDVRRTAKVIVINPIGGRIDVIVEPHHRRRIAASDVKELFGPEEWWPERSVADMQRVIDEGPAIGAWSGERLVGFVRAVTDGVFRAYVEDCVVAEEFRRRGVASAMLGALLTELNHIDVVSLFCSASIVEVYERSGFRATSQVVLHRGKDA